MSGLKELLNDEQGFKSNAKEKLDKKDNPQAVLHGYKQGLDFWEKDINYILESPVIEEEEADGTTFNTIGALINFHSNLNRKVHEFHVIRLLLLQ